MQGTSWQCWGIVVTMDFCARHDLVAWSMWFTHTLGIQAAMAVIAQSNTDYSRLTSDDPGITVAD